MTTVALNVSVPSKCEVEVAGMPVSIMGHHQLVAGHDRYPVQRRMPVHMIEDEMVLRVSGPRYSGALRVDRAQCRPGEVLRIDVKPLPARMSFPCAPPELTVECAQCPGHTKPLIRSAKAFPPLRMSSFTEQFEVVLRAPGYRRKTQMIRVHPGHNKIEVSLEPLPGVEVRHDPDDDY